MESESSLYSCLRDRILNDLLEDICRRAPYLAMIVDKTSISFLSGAVTVLDLTERGISVIEQLEKTRMPMPDIEALYFVTPTDKVVKRIAEDFSSRVATYRTAHLCFTSSLSDWQLTYLAASPIMLFIRTLKEVNCEFRVCGLDAFSLEENHFMGPLYLSESLIDRQTAILALAKKLANLCAMLKEFPYVCYQSLSPQAEELAIELEQQIGIVYRKIPDLQFNENRSTLVILDRKFDLSTPLYHDVHYEPMIRDILGVSMDGRVKYESVDNENTVSNKDATLNELDNIWTKLRYDEVDDAQGTLVDDLNEFRTRNRDVEAAANQEALNIKQVARVVGGLSEYNEYMARFAVHRYLIDLLLKRFVDEGLNEVSEIEQILLTGIDSNRNWIKPGKIVPRVVQKMNQIVDEEDRLRLALLTVICLELKEKHRKMLTDLLQTKHIFLISKLGYLGIQPQTSNKKTLYRDEESLREIVKKIKPIEKVYNYYQPKLRNIIRAALDNQLDPNNFIFGKAAPPNLQGFEGPISVGTSLRKKPAVLKSARGRKRVIIFILGGLSYAEVSLIKEFQNDAQIILGGNKIMAPLDFMEEISSIERQSGYDNGLDPRDVNFQV